MQSNIEIIMHCILFNCCALGIKYPWDTKTKGWDIALLAECLASRRYILWHCMEPSPLSRTISKHRDRCSLSVARWSKDRWIQKIYHLMALRESNIIMQIIYIRNAGNLENLSLKHLISTWGRKVFSSVLFHQKSFTVTW